MRYLNISKMLTPAGERGSICGITEPLLRRPGSSDTVRPL